MQLQDMVGLIENAGFLARGGFHPGEEDRVPDVKVGRPTRTLILVGNAGNLVWNSFASERDPWSDTLDDWTRDKLDEIAKKVGAKALYPFTRPYHPFLRWAQKAEACYISTLGIAIHPDYGLWHAYRGALAIPEYISLPPSDPRKSPCESCLDKPCLRACPVNAFRVQKYDVGACVDHLASSDGHDCMKNGCLARHACPFGREYAYKREQASFLMAAFLSRRGNP